VASSNESNIPKALYASSAAPMDEPSEVEGTRTGKEAWDRLMWCLL